MCVSSRLSCIPYNKARDASKKGRCARSSCPPFHGAVSVCRCNRRCAAPLRHARRAKEECGTMHTARDRIYVYVKVGTKA